MKWEPQEKFVQQSEMVERARELDEKISGTVARESEILKGRGYPVGVDGRILMEQFSEFYRAGDIARDEAYVRKRESGFIRSPVEVIGALLEKVKMIAVNRFWFDGRLISVRTARYDDYHNGVDELIFDTKTFQPIAAIDATTDPLQGGKPEALMKKIIFGSSIKYGVKISDKKVSLGAYPVLPLFIVKIDAATLLRLAENIVRGELDKESGGVERAVLSSWRAQQEKFSNLVSAGLRPAYEKIGKIFRELEGG